MKPVLKYGFCCGTCKHSNQYDDKWNKDFYYQYCFELNCNVPNHDICDEFVKHIAFQCKADTKWMSMLEQEE